MALGDWYQVKLKCTFKGQGIITTWHYLQTGDSGTGDAVTLGGRWLNQILPYHKDCLSSSTVYVTLETKNLSSPTDFTIHTFLSTNGNRTGQNLHQFVTWSFSMLRGRTDMKGGGCRIGGLVEADVEDGLPTGTLLGKLGILEGAFETPLVAGASDRWVMRILGKRDGSLGQFMNPISGVKFIGSYTQNSRKSYTAPGF